MGIYLLRYYTYPNCSFIPLFYTLYNSSGYLPEQEFEKYTGSFIPFIIPVGIYPQILKGLVSGYLPSPLGSKIAPVNLITIKSIYLTNSSDLAILIAALWSAFKVKPHSTHSNLACVCRLSE